MSMHDYRSDIDMWADMWDEMQKDPVTNPPIQKPQPSPFAKEVLGTKAQDTYYDYFDSEDLLQEDTRTPNPVYPDSVGPDNEDPQAVWVNESLLKEIESLKNRLFKLENKMARLGQGSKLAEKKTHGMFDKSMFSEIKALRSRIDRVSSQLGIKDEPSPWKIKRD